MGIWRKGPRRQDVQPQHQYCAGGKSRKKKPKGASRDPEDRMEVAPTANASLHSPLPWPIFHTSLSGSWLLLTMGGRGGS